jgi:hypothetical protein
LHPENKFEEDDESNDKMKNISAGWKESQRQSHPMMRL